MIPPSKDYPWYTMEHAGEDTVCSMTNADLCSLYNEIYGESNREFESILDKTLYLYRKELKDGSKS